MFKTAATLISAATISFGALGASAAMADDHKDAPKTEGEIKLEKMLEGRVAGEAQSCIRMLPSTDLTVIDGTALVYKSGSTLYVNVPRNADQVDDRDTLMTRKSSNRLCRTDIVTTVDRFHGGYTGNILLGDFIPYRRAEG